MILYIAAWVAGLLVGMLLGSRWTVASRTYSDARATTRTARALWGQVPRDWGRVGNVVGGLAIVVFIIVAYFLGRR